MLCSKPHTLPASEAVPSLPMGPSSQDKTTRLLHLLIAKPCRQPQRPCSRTTSRLHRFWDHLLQTVSLKRSRDFLFPHFPTEPIRPTYSRVPEARDQSPQPIVTSRLSPNLARFCSHGNYFCSNTWAPGPFYPSALAATKSASHWPSVYFLWRGADQCRWIGKIVRISLALEILLWLLCLPWISYLSFPCFCCCGFLLANVDLCANQTIRHCDKISDMNISEEEGFILLTVFDSKI